MTYGTIRVKRFSCAARPRDLPIVRVRALMMVQGVCFKKVSGATSHFTLAANDQLNRCVSALGPEFPAWSCSDNRRTRAAAQPPYRTAECAPSHRPAPLWP
jgi:hypothetical protein